MARSPRYFVAINQAITSMSGGAPVFPAGSLQLCESLGLDAVSIRKASLDVDVLEMEQHRVRGGWAVALNHGTNVRLVREDPETGSLTQVFMGRVVSPMESRESSRRRRVVRVLNVMQLARECLFTRGRWVTYFLPPPPAGAGYPFFGINSANNANGHECTLFEGMNFFLRTSGAYAGYRVASWVRQSVRRAVDEWGFNFAALAARGLATAGPALPGGPSIPVESRWVWAPLQARITDLGTPIWPDPGGYAALSYLDWLIRITQPMPDAFSTVLYDGLRPEVVVGRYDKVTPVEIEVGAPCTSVHVGREVHEEAAGVVVVSQVDTVPFRTRSPGVGFPSPPVPNLLDPRVIPIDWVPGPGTYVEGDVTREIGALLTAQRWSGSVTLSDGAWKWCRPGSVLSLGGSARMHVQETTVDLSTEAVTASVGMPRHLGQRGMEDVLAWMRGNFGTEATA
jgi:hypothetical protein